MSDSEDPDHQLVPEAVAYRPRARRTAAAQAQAAFQTYGGVDDDDADLHVGGSGGHQRSRSGAGTSSGRGAESNKRARESMQPSTRLASANAVARSSGYGGEAGSSAAVQAAAGGNEFTPEEEAAMEEAWMSVPHGTDEEEAKRLKRLLRNRVSAQLARERKKAYVTGLEDRNKELEAQVKELEMQVTKLEKDNETLRRIIRTMNPPVGAPKITPVPVMPAGSTPGVEG